MAIHLTGQYPDWWTGRRWDRPIRAWAGSEKIKVTRDGIQKALLGEPTDVSRLGTGAVPRNAILSTSRQAGVPAALQGAVVRHASGGNSILGFKSYEEGRPAWQAETLDLVWFDEEPPHDIYMEGLTRTNATEGMVYLTFTPLKGMSDVVSMFLNEGSDARD